MQVYCAFKNADQTEGRGPMVLEAIFDTVDKANRYLDRKYGQQWGEVRAYDVTTSDPDLFLNAQLRRQALAKLNDEERKALGV